MKKFNLFLLLLLSFSISCASLKKNISKGTTVDDDMVVVVGKIDFDPPLEQKITSPCIGMSDVFYSLYTKDPNAEPVTMMDADLGVTHNYPAYKKGEYFIVKFPKKLGKIYMTSVHAYPTVHSEGSTHFEVFPKLAINYESTDNFIYIGDILFTIKRNTISMKVQDNYKKVKQMFNGYVVDNNGASITPTKRFVKVNKKLKAKSTDVRYIIRHTYL